MMKSQHDQVQEKQNTGYDLSPFPKLQRIIDQQYIDGKGQHEDCPEQSCPSEKKQQGRYQLQKAQQYLKPGRVSEECPGKHCSRHSFKGLCLGPGMAGQHKLSLQYLCNGIREHDNAKCVPCSTEVQMFFP